MIYVLLLYRINHNSNTSLEPFRLDPRKESLSDFIISAGHVLPVHVLTLFLCLLLHSSLQQMHLDVSCLVLCDYLVYCSTLPWVHIWVKRFPCLVFLPNILELILSKSEGDIGLADSVVDIRINTHISPHILLIND